MPFTKEYISFENTKQFSKLFLDYIQQQEKTKQLYSSYFDLESVKSFLNANPFSYVNRTVLTEELLQQNKEIHLSEASKKNIELLAHPNTYTITTGHQLCLFTGPLYFIYKILTTINACEYLNSQIPSNHFVPVYWLASEDHDFAEVNHAFVFGKKITWNTSQTGKVGSFTLDGLDEVIQELSVVLGESDAANKLIDLFKNCYSSADLTRATRKLVNELMGKYGLVILDGDSKNLKQLFSKEINSELFEGFAYKAVSETNEYLKQHDYPTQVFPREINLFFAREGIRERIEKSGNVYKVLNTELAFSKEEVEALVQSHIEYFSPNVVLRPVYQQKILPNIAYVGGPGEIAYWLQLKAEFDVCGVHYPILLPRKFALLIDSPTNNKLQKLQLAKADVFEDTESLIKKLISSDKEQIDFSKERTQLNETFSQIKQQAENIDKTLSGTVEGELQKTLKGLENIEQKIVRALKTKNETSINQLKSVKQKLFPEDSVQERFDNFSAYYLKNENLIDDLKQAFETNLLDLSSYLLLEG